MFITRKSSVSEPHSTSKTENNTSPTTQPIRSDCRKVNGSPLIGKINDSPKEPLQQRGPHLRSMTHHLVQHVPARDAKSESNGDIAIGKNVQIEGTIKSFDSLDISGSLDGDLKGYQLTVGETGACSGKAEVSNMVIVGRFQGNAIVSEHLLVKSTGFIDGTISYLTIEIENGGMVSGKLTPLNANTEKSPEKEPSGTDTPKALPTQKAVSKTIPVTKKGS